MTRLAAFTVVLAGIFLMPSNVSAQTAVSDAPVIERAVDVASLVLKNRRAEWLEASLPQRVKIAEEIGEEGAEALMKQRGLNPLLTKPQKKLPQGFDQVWIDPKTGQVVAVEAKGGTSALNRGYGHVQGTSEWAVAAAIDLCISNGRHSLTVSGRRP
jgi:hypothetical protein